MIHSRRDFLRAAAAGLACAPALRSAGSEALIEVLVDEPIATIAPQIYGHFAENLGGVVYDGIWVGEDSPVPNIGGVRKQLVEALRRIHPPVVRWPGGCFADSYDWRDGTGPRNQRPRRTNFWLDAREWAKNRPHSGPQIYDPNQFGTVEFARFCKLAGAQPYLAANMRGMTALEFDRWVEYCNSPAGSTTLADKRAADGAREPLDVRYWGVGNEAWGCGGNFVPEDYATEFLRFTAWVPGYDVPLAFVGSGPDGNNRDWTRRFFAKLAEKGAVGSMWGWSMHHYAWNATGGRVTDWLAAKGDALQFDATQYYEILREAALMDSFITSQWEVMAEHDRQHHVKLVVDEWGAWYASGTEPFPAALLGQQSTMRDAVLAGSTLNTFNGHADKIGLAAIAQLVNNLQALFLAHEDKFCVTPTYHVFDMYAAHQGAQSLRTVTTAPTIYKGLAGLSCSASLRGKALTVTVANPSIDQPREVDIRLRGASVASATAVVLAAADVHAHNSFENPHAVEPRTEPGLLRRFPPASVTKLEITLV
ncbi:MAG TPA: alpha-L-arabinofuranosidase C-terminal domain-containing protein [Bryobacteraceae bacterium]|nr:alpha-L-arabinofuranosidase C-terminal domain-containing protein [Bryobacteraceae bacterium]